MTQVLCRWGAMMLLGGVLSAGTLTNELLPSTGNRVGLEVDKTGLWSGRKHIFTFERYKGTVLHDPAHPELSQVRFAVESGSIVNHDPWVSEKDRKKVVDFALSNMLAVDKYPEVTFVSERIAAAGTEQFDVYGTLTIRGIGKPAVVHVRVNPDSFEGTSQIRMTDYGLKPPKAALGTIGTKDEMSFSFTLRRIN